MRSDTDDSQRASSLSWVKEEVGKSLDEARIALEDYVESGEGEDEAKLTRCLSMIQQIRGTLQMVQMEGATVLTEEMESLAGALINNKESITDLDSAYEALMRAILQLPDYLDKVQTGQSDLAIILLPLINDLRVAHGQNAVAAKALFAPHFHGILPQEIAEADEQEDDLLLLIRKKRHQVHLAMLGVFRNRDFEQSLNRLIKLYERFQARARSEPVIQMYWVITALAEAIRDSGLEPDMPVNSLLGQVDRQSKRIMDHGEEPIAADPPMELIRLLLFYIASSSSEGEKVSQIKQAFRLEKYLPSDDDLGRLRSELAGPGSEVLEKVVLGIRQEIDRARDMLDIYTRTGGEDNEKLELMVQALRNVAGTVAMVGDEELQESINTYCHKLDGLIHGEASADESGLSELADFILKVDARLQDIQSFRSEKVREETGETSLGSSGFWDVMSAVVRESSVNMSNAKDAISAFAEAPDEERRQLEAAAGLLQQVAGSLKIASLDRASDVIYALRSYIEQELVAKKITPSANQMETLAEVVSSADYYLEAVVDDLPNKDAALDLAEAALDLMGYAPDISSRFQALEDEPSEDGDEDDTEVYEIEEDQEGLQSIADDLAESFTDEAVEPSDEIELNPDDFTDEDGLGDVDTTEALAEVDEQDADIEEIEVAAPVETEEEMAERLSEVEEDIFEDLPSIEAVEETVDATIEEISVDAPVETEEEMMARVQSEINDEGPAIDFDGIEVESVEPVIEEVNLESIDDEVPGLEQDEIDAEESGVSQQVDLSLSMKRSALSELSPLGEDFDEEIVDIFLEEADDVIAVLQTQFPIWKDDLECHDALAIIRRSFHTLKGSGRMVGANLVGEFSWEVENLLNHVMNKSRQANESVLSVVSDAIDALPAMIAQLQGGPESDADIVAIADRAHAIVVGEREPVQADDQDEKAQEQEQAEREPEVLSESELVLGERLSAIEDSISVSADLYEESTPSSPLKSDELRKVYTMETEQHISAMRSFIEQCRAGSGSCLFQDEHLRVLHTLHGGAATVGADEIKILLDSAEPLTILYEEYKVAADESLLALYERMLEQIEAFLGEINGNEGVFEQDTGLILQFEERLTADEQRFSEAGPPDEREPELAAEPGEIAALNEIESSLENLHDLMSADDIQAVPSNEVAVETPVEAEEEEGKEQIDAEMFEVFLEEVGELLTSIDDSLDIWQSDYTDREMIDTIMRDIHTIKGGARMLEQQAFADISHAMETLLIAVADERVGINEQLISLLHTARDSLQDIYEGLNSGDESFKAEDNTKLIQQMESLRTARQAEDEQEVLPPEEEPDFDDEEEEEPSRLLGALEYVDKEEPSYVLDLLEVFTDEARELMQTIDQSLHDWHTDSDNRQLISHVQRDIHTLKGGARMVNLAPMGDLAHAIEALLASVAEGRTEITEPLFEVLYEAKDHLQDMFESIVGGETKLGDRSEQIQKLDAMHHADDVEEQAGVAVVADALEEFSPSGATPALDDDSDQLGSLYEMEQTPSGALSAYSGEETPSGALDVFPSEETPSGALDTFPGEETPSKATPAVEGKADRDKSAKDRRGRARSEKGTIRIRSDLIDGLVNLAGETNIFRSRLEQQGTSFRFSLSELDQTVSRLRDQLRKMEIETETQILFRHEKDLDDSENENFDPLEMDRYSNLQQLSRGLIESVGDLNSLQGMLGTLNRDADLLLVQQGRVNTELQDRLMQARVVPFAASLASRLRRIIRQTCQQLDKKAELKLIGANEEMDRHVLDRMVAPLEHMLRNAIAHGIESPAVRKQRGKPETGTVTISVGREGGEIVIQVADDGGGLDVNAIRKKAEEKKMIVENADMNDEDIMQLILQPGFSTAETVNQIAGRGVGMDVVSNEIKQLGGSLNIESVAERGAAITVRLPFTLAITQALLVAVGTDLYAIPLSSIEGVSRIGREEVEDLISKGDEGEYTYGGDKYQVSRLGTVLGRTQTEHDLDRKPAVIMVRAGGHRVAFYIDAIMGHHEIVVKSLGAQISSVNGMAGGTILGDGRVALILDVPALVRMVAAEHELSVTDQISTIEMPRKVGVTVMVVDDSITVRRVTTRLLERHDMEVVTAKDGVEAMALLEDTIPDVMLLDIEMPRMDGYEVASHMRNDERYKNVPIVMITSRTGAKHRKRAEAIGVDRYMGKPYQETELLANISEVLGVKGSNGKPAH